MKLKTWDSRFGLVSDPLWDPRHAVSEAARTARRLGWTMTQANHSGKLSRERAPTNGGDSRRICEAYGWHKRS